MVIAHAIRRLILTDGGPVRTTIDLLTCMSESGLRTKLFCPMPRDLPGSWLAGHGPEVVTFPTRGGPIQLLSPSTIRHIRSHLHDVDILHLQVPWEPLNYQLSRIARSMGIRYCVSTRGTLDDWALAQKSLKKKFYLSLFARRMLEQAAFVHCTSRQEAAESLRHFPRGRVRIIPNFLEIRDLLPQDVERRRACLATLGLQSDHRVVLFLSRVFPGKGLELLIDAMPAVLQRFPKARLVIAGPGNFSYLQDLRARIAAMGVSQFTLFAGYVDGVQKRDLLAAADLVALPSHHENFGNVLFEASACGTPLLVSREVATWQELQEGVAARVIDRNVPSVSDGICRILEVPEGQRTIARADASAWMHRYLDRSRILRLYEQAYADALTGPAAPQCPESLP